jgi:hypothetical protein
MHALDAAHGVSWRATDEFREALCGYVDELRAGGLGPVDMLLTVKRTLRDVSPALLERSVKWCIEAYYRAA